jgi:hypothetical protein
MMCRRIIVIRKARPTDGEINTHRAAGDIEAEIHGLQLVEERDR